MIEALRARRRAVHEVWLPERLTTPGLRELGSVARASGAHVHRCASADQVAARGDPLPEEPFEALLSGAGPRRFVALDRVTDAGNLGSIARSALAAGFQGLLLEHRHAPAIGPGALRASAGALEHLRIGRAPRLGRALALARREGLSVLAADRRGEPIDRVPRHFLRAELVWVFGSEDRGVRESLMGEVDACVGIPMHGEIDSLGVAAAAAYLLHRTAEAIRLAEPLAGTAEMPYP